MEVPPLADWVDLDSITAVLANSETADLTLAMSIEELNIFVSGHGEIRVCDATQETPPTPVFAVESDGIAQAG